MAGLKCIALSFILVDNVPSRTMLLEYELHVWMLEIVT